MQHSFVDAGDLLGMWESVGAATTQKCSVLEILCVIQWILFAHNNLACTYLSNCLHLSVAVFLDFLFFHVSRNVTLG